MKCKRFVLNDIYEDEDGDAVVAGLSSLRPGLKQKAGTVRLPKIYKKMRGSDDEEKWRKYSGGV